MQGSNAEYSNLSDAFTRIKHVIYVIGLVLYVIANSRNEDGTGYHVVTSRYVAIPLFLFLLMTMLFKTHHALIQTWVLITKPEEWHEAADLMQYKRCLSVVPINESIIYSNSFEYPSGTLEERDVGMHLTAFGNQAYAANSFYEKFPVTEQRVSEQKMVLANRGTTLTDVCQLLDQNQNQGYAVLDKNYIYPDSIKPYFIYENNTCAVFTSSSRICK